MKTKVKSMIGVLVLCITALFMAALVYPEAVKAAPSGYTDHAHSWSASEDCGGCKKKSGYTDCTDCKHTGSISCKKCSGKGYTLSEPSELSNEDESWKEGKWEITIKGCPDCGGSGTQWEYYESKEDAKNRENRYRKEGSYTAGAGKKSCSTCSGKGYRNSYCVRCNGTGTNYQCTNEGCTLRNTDYKSTYKYNNWASELSGNKNGSNWYTSAMHSVCYTTENAYGISFSGNGSTGGSMTGLSGCLYDNVYTLPANGYEKTGYTFRGWNTKADGSGTAYADRQSVSKLSSANGASVVLYAQWQENAYSISFSGNGSTGGSMTVLSGCLYDNVYTLPANGYEKTGYTFRGWNTKADGSGTAYADRQSVSKLSSVNGASVVLYAQWQAQEYTISLQPNGGTINGAKSFTVIYGSFASRCISGAAPVRNGYEFLGWYDAPSGGTCVYDSDGNAVYGNGYWSSTGWCHAGAVTLYARWKSLKFTVTFDGNGGAADIPSADYLFGERVELGVTAEKEGYLFVGWNTDPDADHGLDSMEMPEHDVRLYAIYSIPVSDIKEVYLKIWPQGEPETYRTYYLGRTAEKHMEYTYQLEHLNTDFLQGRTPEYAVIVKDHAGNKTALAGEETEVFYVQTVEHYMLSDGRWVRFDTVTETLRAGEVYTPSFLVPPDGYEADSIAQQYVVEKDTVTAAYYKPIEYRLYFDANGGSCSTEYKSIHYGEAYGELPVPKRRGYEFIGWYTQKDAGSRKDSADRHLVLSDTTLYAGWKITAHTVFFDYETNGGDSATKLQMQVEYNGAVDLTPTAQKEGWEFLGWNTDPDAEHGMESLVMGEEDITLYAIYKKDIRVIFLSQTKDGQLREEQNYTMFNQESQVLVSVPAQGEFLDWIPLGWTTEKLADGEIHASAGSDYPCSEDVVFYGRYAREVTLSYDTNGSPAEIAAQTKTRFFHAAGVYENPSFVTAKAPLLTGSSFALWVDGAGECHSPETEIEVTEDTVLTARWDRYPVITAYDRYFTLQQAVRGDITREALLAQVMAEDEEDGTLVNGEAVLVDGYDSFVFTSMTQNGTAEITYVATDSFGNVSRKSIVVHIADAAVKESGTRTYYRFISSRFYCGESGLIPAEDGGLEKTSVWRTDESYRRLLDRALSNKRLNRTYKKVSYFGVEQEVLQAGSGEWEHMEESWYFPSGELKKMKTFVQNCNPGMYTVSDYLNLFMEWFGGCRKK